MKVAIGGGKIQQGDLEGVGEDGAVLPRRDAAEPAFPNVLQPGRAPRQSYGKGWTDRQARMDREQG